MSLLDAFKLEGKVAIVTGGNSGLGEAFAMALAEVGAQVAIAARNHQANLRMVERITALGGQAIAVDVDITDPAQVERMAEEVGERLGPIDILVNNAGLCIHRPALDVPHNEWHQVWDVNVHGLWYCAQSVGRGMVERRRGVIVNIGSISAQIVNRPQMQPAYNASKAAVHQLTKSLAAEWAPFNVRVNAMAPGYIKTAMAPVDQPEFRIWREDTPQQRYALPEELGPTLVYLASDASSYMTGSVLVIDGGYTLW